MDNLSSKQWDEKHTLLEEGEIDTPSSPPTSSTRPRRSRFVVFSLLSLLGFLWLSRRVLMCHNGHHHVRMHTENNLSDDQSTIQTNITNIALEAHIMSKCPDARDCLQMLVVPTMEAVFDKVDFRLSYIGSLDPMSDEVHCKHGPSECLGNIIQLCAAKIYPDPKLYLGFANCMISDYQRIPERELVEGCAMEHGLDFQQLNRCISEEGPGMQLLRNSVEWSTINNVRTSCTVRLEGQTWCVRDGGEWTNCPGSESPSDLVEEIRKLYLQKNHA